MSDKLSAEAQKELIACVATCHNRSQTPARSYWQDLMKMLKTGDIDKIDAAEAALGNYLIKNANSFYQLRDWDTGAFFSYQDTYLKATTGKGLNEIEPDPAEYHRQLPDDTDDIPFN